MSKPITSMDQCLKIRNRFEKRIQVVLDAHKDRINFLFGFKHGFKTSASKKILTNQDAIVLAFYDKVSFTTFEAKVILNAWRSKTFTATDFMTKISSWKTSVWENNNMGRHNEEIRFSRPEFKLISTYLFNASRRGGGYNFVGRDINSLGKKMRSYHNGQCNGRFDDGHVHFRKHCWYRLCKDRYAMTIVGMVRAAEFKSANIIS